MFKDYIIVQKSASNFKDEVFSTTGQGYAIHYVSNGSQ